MSDVIRTLLNFWHFSSNKARNLFISGKQLDIFHIVVFADSFVDFPSILEGKIIILIHLNVYSQILMGSIENAGSRLGYEGIFRGQQ